MFKLDLEKAEEQEIKLPTSIGSYKKQENSRKISSSAWLTMLKPLTVWITTNWIMEKGREFQKNIYFCFIDYAKAFGCVDHNKLWKIYKKLEYQTILPASWEIHMQVRKQQLELDMEQQIGSKSGRSK